MSAAPRIVRAAPRGPITTPDPGIPVIVVLHWYGGEVARIPATAVAWTQDAVEIQWEAPEGGMRRDWVPAVDVSRPDPRGRRDPDFPAQGEESPDPQGPPRNRPGHRKRQW